MGNSLPKSVSSFLRAGFFVIKMTGHIRGVMEPMKLDPYVGCARRAFVDENAKRQVADIRGPANDRSASGRPLDCRRSSRRHVDAFDASDLRVLRNRQQILSTSL
jgi:hypothetical protein